MTTLTIYGASDDLIEIEGDLRAEFGLGSDDLSFLAFSDGTVLSVTYGDEGIWRISPRVKGSAELTVIQGTDPDTDYTDRATIAGDLDWVVAGSDFLRVAPSTVPDLRHELLLIDYKDSTPFEALAAASTTVFNGRDLPAIQLVPNSHRDEYAVLVSSRRLESDALQAVYDAWVWD